MLGVLKAGYQRVLIGVIVLVRVHIVLVHRLLDARHVAIHSECALDLHLLVKHLLVRQLVVSLLLLVLLIERTILGSLQLGLLFVEVRGVVHLFDDVLLVYLHLNLLHVHAVGL